MASLLGARTLLGAPGKGATRVSWPYYLEQVATSNKKLSGTLSKFSQFAPQLQSSYLPIPTSPIQCPYQCQYRSTDPSSSVFAPCFSIHIDCSTPPGLQHDFIPRFILRSNSPNRGHTNQTTNINPDTRMKKQPTHTDHQSYLTHVTDDRPAGSILLLCYLLKQSSKSSHSNLRLSWSRKLQTTWLHDSEQGSVTVTGYTVTGPV